MHSFLNIKDRIIITFFIVGLLVFLVGTVVVTSGLRNESTFRTFADVDSQRFVTLVMMRELVANVGIISESIVKFSEVEEKEEIIKELITHAGQIEQLYEVYRALGANTDDLSSSVKQKENPAFSSINFSRILEQKERLVFAVVNYRLLLAQASLPRSNTEENNIDSSDVVEIQAISMPSVDPIVAESLLLTQYITDTLESERLSQVQSGQQVSRSVEKTNMLMFLGTMLIIVVLVGIAVFFRMWIWRPLDVLRTVSLAIAKGDSTAIASISTKDEIGDVARAFNLMLLRVRHAKQEVEEKAKKLSNTLLELGHLQKQTSEERALYELLLVSVGDAVLVLNPSLDIALANEHAADVLKKDKEQIVATKITELFDLTYREMGTPFDDEAFWLDVFTRKEPVIFQNELMIKDSRGINIPVEMIVAPVIGDDKKVHSLVITFRDITDMVRLEEARVSFISAASHQLRTPLSSMRWFTEMLLDGDLGEIEEKQKEALTTFSESTLRMISLVNALLQLSRVEARRIEIKPVPINIITLAQEVATSLLPKALDKKQTITVHENTAMYEILLDKDIVWQAIMNYLTNALRYGATKSNIELEATVEGKYIKVSVSNNGIGIPEDAKSHIFEKFYRASNAQKEVPNGNGIGLAFVKTMIEDLGGTVGFSSIENEKTVFWFTVPLNGMKGRKGEVSLAV